MSAFAIQKHADFHTAFLRWEARFLSLGFGASKSTAGGTEINADMNGALNIARKELGDEWLKKQLKTNGGRMNRPVSVRDIGQTLKEGLRSLETAFVRAR